MQEPNFFQRFRLRLRLPFLRIPRNGNWYGNCDIDADQIIAKMRRLYIFLLLSLFSVSLYGQSPVEKRVKEIRKWYGEIENEKTLAALEHRQFSYECYDDPDLGEFEFFLKDGEVVKMVWSHGYEHGAEQYSFYFHDKELFFCFLETGGWTFDPEDENAENTIDYFEEDRYYFQGDKLVRCLHKEWEEKSRLEHNPSSATTPNVEVDDCDPEPLIELAEKLEKLKYEDIGEKSCWLEKLGMY